MKRRFLILGLLFCLFTTGCLAQENTNFFTDTTNPPQEELAWDFGQVKEGLILKHDFILKNRTEKILNITGAHTSCGCAVSRVEKNTLLPLEETRIEVRFNSAGYSGAIEQFVYVNTDDAQNPVLKFTIKAEVFKSSGPCETWDFAKIKEGEIVTHGFTVKNKTQETLNILEVKTTCGCTGTKIHKNTLLAGEETILEVHFNSSGYSGPVEKTIYVQTDDPDDPLLSFIVKAEVVK